MFYLTLTLSTVLNIYIDYQISNFSSNKFSIRRESIINVQNLGVLAIPNLLNGLNSKNINVSSGSEECLTVLYKTIYRDHFISPDISKNKIKNKYTDLFNDIKNESNKNNFLISHYVVTEMIIDGVSFVEISNFLNKSFYTRTNYE